jgi:ferric-dicitrate binding protein FerR (iron transport regulator)
VEDSRWYSRARDECVRQINRDGRESWKEEIGYHRRSIAETAMSRLKGAFGEKLKNRKLESQKQKPQFDANS